MIQHTVQVENRLGLHARAAARLVRVASKYSSQVHLSREGTERRIDGKSVLSILLLAASQGARLVISVDGEDEVEAGEAVRRLFEDKFEEESG